MKGLGEGTWISLGEKNRIDFLFRRTEVRQELIMRGSVGEEEEIGLREKMHEETARIEGYLRGGENLE